MTRHPVIDAFPSRPLVLSKPPRGWWHWLVPLGFAAWAIWGWVVTVPLIVDDVRLGSASAVARDPRMPAVGRCKGYFIFKHCEFRLVFRDDKGSIRSSQQDMVTTLSTVDTAQPLELRYDPTRPDRVSTSWGRALLVNRVLTQLFFVACLAFLVWIVMSTQLDTLRQRRLLGRIGRQPRAVVADVTRVHRVGASTQVDYAWSDPTGVKLTGAAVLEDGAEPLWIDADHTRILVLVGPDPGSSYAPDAKLKGVSLTQDERRAIASAQRLAALSEASVASQAAAA